MRRDSKFNVFIYSLLLVNILGVSVAQAATCEDVRMLYGKSGYDTKEYHDYVEYVDSYEYLIGRQQNAASLLNESGLVGRLEEQHNSLKLGREETLGELRGVLESDGDTLKTLGKAREFISADAKVRNFKLSDEDFSAEVSTERLDELNSVIGDTRRYMNDTFEIGELGADKSWVVNISHNKVVKAFGEAIEGLSGSENGVSVYARGADRCQSGYAGVVTAVSKSESYGNWVEVQSGKGLSISYSGLERPLVQVGQTVEQGQDLGILDKGTRDRDGTQFIYVEAKLDGELVNPMLLYGKRGIEAYNDYISVQTGKFKTEDRLSLDSYDFTPTDSVWYTKETEGILEDTIIVIK